MDKRIAIAGVLTAGLLSGCVSAPTAPAVAPAPVNAGRPLTDLRGLEDVVGHDARHLFALFGQPQLDIRERTVRKLQFGSTACVLDTYLYAPARGKEPVVTYVDARDTNGNAVDRAGCVAALKRG